MTIDLCDLRAALNCVGSPDKELFRSLVLRGLLGVIDAVEASSGGGTSGADGVVLPQVSKAFGSITNTFADIGLLDSTKKLRQLYVDNMTDADIAISLDGGSTTAFTVFANSTLDRELGPFVAAAITSMQIKYVGTAPTVGSAYFDGSH